MRIWGFGVGAAKKSMLVPIIAFLLLLLPRPLSAENPDPAPVFKELFIGVIHDGQTERITLAAKGVMPASGFTAYLPLPAAPSAIRCAEDAWADALLDMVTVPCYTHFGILSDSRPDFSYEVLVLSLFTLLTFLLMMCLFLFNGPMSEAFVRLLYILLIVAWVLFIAFLLVASAPYTAPQSAPAASKSDCCGNIGGGLQSAVFHTPEELAAWCDTQKSAPMDAELRTALETRLSQGEYVAALQFSGKTRWPWAMPHVEIDFPAESPVMIPCGPPFLPSCGRLWLEVAAPAPVEIPELNPDFCLRLETNATTGEKCLNGAEQSDRIWDPFVSKPLWEGCFVSGFYSSPQTAPLNLNLKTGSGEEAPFRNTCTFVSKQYSRNYYKDVTFLFAWGTALLLCVIALIFRWASARLRESFRLRLGTLALLHALFLLDYAVVAFIAKHGYFWLRQ